MTRVCMELNSLGLITTVQPAATAEASFEANEKRICVPRGNQTGHPDRFHVTVVFSNRGSREFLKRRFGCLERVDAGPHDQSGELYDYHRIPQPSRPLDHQLAPRRPHARRRKIAARSSLLIGCTGECALCRCDGAPRVFLVAQRHAAD